jgi:hypothetical protein
MAIPIKRITTSGHPIIASQVPSSLLGRKSSSSWLKATHQMILPTMARNMGATYIGPIQFMGFARLKMQCKRFKLLKTTWKEVMISISSTLQSGSGGP